MSKNPNLPLIAAEDILTLSPRYPVTYQDDELIKVNPLNGFGFESDLTAVAYKALRAPGIHGRIDIPLDMAMTAAFRSPDTEPESKKEPDDKSDSEVILPTPAGNDLSAENFRIVLKDREVAPDRHRGCAVMPYVLYNGIVSVALTGAGIDGAEEGFSHDAFWLNVYEEGVAQPFSGVTDPNLQINLDPTDRPPEEVIARYMLLKERAGKILEEIFNTTIAAGPHRS